MIYTIENEILKVSVDTNGAQLCSVVRKSDNTEHMWQADPAVWGYHAPILFPYAGKLTGGALEAKGNRFDGGQHGFARNMEHSFVRQNDREIVLELTDCEQTLSKWPYRFRLVSTFTIDGDSLCHRLTVENRDGGPMRFGIGYHPAFAVPFDEKHCCEDYEFRFDTPQSPICLGCLPLGLLNGKWGYDLGRNVTSIPLTRELFANDSYCMTGLSAKTFGIYERGSGRGVECDISGFPQTLIWSKPDWPARFVCIEPWMSLPGTEDGSSDWSRKAAAAEIQPGQSWSVDMKLRFVR